MISGSLQPLEVRLLSVCTVTTLYQRNQVVDQFLRKSLAIGVSIRIVIDRSTIYIACGYHDNRRHVSICYHVVKQVSHHAVLVLKEGGCCFSMPMYEIEHIIAFIG